MKVEYHFKNLQHSKNLTKQCDDLIEHLGHFIHHDIKAQIFFSIENTFEKTVRVHIRTLQHEHTATGIGESLAEAVDAAFAKVQRQLLKTKEKTKNRKGREKARDVYLSGAQDEEAA